MLSVIAQELHQLYRTHELIIPEHYLITPRDFIAYRTVHPHISQYTQETLIIESTDNELCVGLYLDPRIIRQLLYDNPKRQIHQGNFEASCLAIEGISHLLCILWKAQRGERVTQLELELQAEIDKYVLLAQWLREQGQQSSALLTQLFEHYNLAGGTTSHNAQRYHRANHLAQRYCTALEAQHLVPNRIQPLHRRLRAFYRQSHWQKLRTIQAPA